MIEWLVLGGVGLTVTALGISQVKQYKQQKKQLLAKEERKRVEACGKVVLSFANNLGYIAKSCISRDELERLIKSGITAEELSKTIQKKIDDAPGLILGYQTFNGADIKVKLPQEIRDKHVYLIGRSGSGKTNELRNLIGQDLKAGCGLAVIAPEQEMLTEEILPYIPENRIDDVIYINPVDTEQPVCFNPLHLDPDEDVDLKVDECLTIFKRVIGHTGPRMDEILRQALYALVAHPKTTLLDVEQLLDRTDDSFRKEVIRQSQDPQVVHFFKDVYPHFPSDAHLPITNRLGQFLRPKAIRTVLCNPNQSLDFRKAMDSNKVILCNLSDGVLGEQNSQLLGQLIVSKFQLATMARAKIAKEQRKIFYLYLDEFSTFTGTSSVSYEKMLSRSRKYKLGLILCHQQTGQIPTDLLKEILGNVSTTICFSVSREDAMKFSKELITAHNGEITNIPEEKILSLKVGQAWCKIGQHSLLLNTYLADQHPDQERAMRIIEHARRNYGAKATNLQPISRNLEKQEDITTQINIDNSYSVAGASTAQIASAEQVLENLNPDELF